MPDGKTIIYGDLIPGIPQAEMPETFKEILIKCPVIDIVKEKEGEKPDDSEKRSELPPTEPTE